MNFDFNYYTKKAEPIKRDPKDLTTELLPTYYAPFAKNILENDCGYRFQLVAQDSSEDFEILYYGDLQEDLIAWTDNAPSKVVAKAVSTGEEIVIYDGMSHGYDNLAWQEHPKFERPLKKSNLGQGKIFIEVEPLDDSEEDWELDSKRNVKTNHGRKIPWEEFKRNAITWLKIYFFTKDGRQIEIIDEELA